MEIATSNNEIIKNWTEKFVPQINESKNRLGIKHHRTEAAIPSTAKFVKRQGEITSIGILMSKGEIFTHKGVGKSGNRIAKEWFNPIADANVSELADLIAENTGDVIAGHINID